jgi:hypothetical protein
MQTVNPQNVKDTEALFKTKQARFEKGAHSSIMDILPRRNKH